jgi:hypothetical protein
MPGEARHRGEENRTRRVTTFGFGAPNSSARIRAHDVVPWSAVVRVDRRGVVVEDGTEPR